MIGVTASAGALIYLFAGAVALSLVAPVAVAVLLGSYASTRLGSSWPRMRLRFLFVAVLGIAAVLLVLRALGVVA